MKRAAVLLLILLLLSGCASKGENTYSDACFSATLPDGFTRVTNTSILCFAPHGNPMRASSITFNATELNWYFDAFTADEYEAALKEQCGYESLTLIDVKDCRVDGNKAKRIACRVELDQGQHDLIVYAVSADRIYFFTLLNREGDPYTEPFDAMMNSLRFTGDV